MLKDSKLINLIILISFWLLMSFQVFAESGGLYEGPTDPAGDRSAVRVGVMNGNQMMMAFSNNTQIANKYLLDGSKWPRDSEKGLQIFDFLAVLVGAQVFLEQDTIPVTSEAEIESRTDLDTLYYIETIWNYHGMLDLNPAGDVVWGLYPVPGYCNELSETPAVSDDPLSWPPAGWPARGFEKKWPGEWNGRFGRGVQYAQKECYFVANDAQDQEYLQPGRRVKYYPRPGVKIGDLNPNVTIQKGMPWGGLGVRIEVRGYQWENPQTRDVIFWEYNISNISEHDLPRTSFGYFVDMGVGNAFNFGDDADDLGGFVEEADMAYIWDSNGTGAGGYIPGVCAVTFLESPGISIDNIDNDDDGLIDEKRDNVATQKVGPYDGIADLSKFLAYYGLKEDQLKEHWDADEDQDWRDGNDVNGNGIYDGTEDPGDDVGLDGVGPYDLNYNGPDADGTECNHKPDLLIGVGAEPNFGLTDITETDMLGLTSFHFIPWPFDDPPAPKYDKDLYGLLGAQELVEFSGKPGDYAPVFGSGSFVLAAGTTERVSCAMMGAYENIAALNSGADPYSLVEKKRIVQLIYESDYRFAKAPETPTLHATASDGKVVLTWDRRAELFTAEPLLGGENDFEGYKLYKSTDRSFSDAQRVFDGFGNPSGKVPIFQCDLYNDIYGFTDYGLIQGESFFLGNNTGIQHYYIDEDVENGRTYYYYLVAYDRGIKGIDANIAPAENVASIIVDEDENVVKVSKNVQIVTPHQRPTDYVSPSLEVVTNEDEIKGSGTVNFRVFNDLDLIPGNEYKLSFLVDTIFINPLFPNISLRARNIGYRVTNETEGIVIFEETIDNFSGKTMLYNNADRAFYLNPTITSDPFDGIIVSVIDSGSYDPEYDSLMSGWVGDGIAPIKVNVKENAYKLFPWRYDIVFGDDIQSNTHATNISSIRKVEGIDDFDKNYLMPEETMHFYVENKLYPDTDTTKVDFIAYDANKDGQFDLLHDDVIVGYSKMVNDEMKWILDIFNFNFRKASSESELPTTGQVYRVDGKRPFLETDEFVVRVNEPDVESMKNAEDLSKIKVVPNPYIVTNTMEPSVRNIYLNQRRRIMFTHIPAECDIKIFTISGYLVDEISVNNEPNNGIVQWDLLTKDGLEVAPGVYFYYLKSRKTGNVRRGKFAILK
ncbi:MAG: hypothetical protein DRP96_04300 [Candidatus Neomarinimicrobiota bacterium]|nr:MAG: hypothetical protein DRP96_04300 [Candidatus Neomarinimicrobiota bacterium]